MQAKIVLEGEQSENDQIRAYTLHQTGKLLLGIRKVDWKYLDHQGSGGNVYGGTHLTEFIIPEKDPKAQGQLYNLAEDPGESNNVYSQFPEVVSELKSKLEEFCRVGTSRA
mgnify:CR=1 FL=1